MKSRGQVLCERPLAFHLNTYRRMRSPSKRAHRIWQLEKRGKLVPAQEETAARQFERLMDVLSAAGYDHYEISNFSKSGFQSKHNSSYWAGVPYLGIGPGAHSFDGATRQFNIRNNAQYVRSIQTG